MARTDGLALISFDQKSELTVAGQRRTLCLVRLAVFLEQALRRPRGRSPDFVRTPRVRTSEVWSSEPELTDRTGEVDQVG